MKAIYAVAAVGLGLMGSIASVSAQPYGSRDYGYEERGRGIMAERGEIISVDKDGKKSRVGSTGDADALLGQIKFDGWNKYKIVARGNVLQHYINDVLMSELQDSEPGKSAAEGVLALQLHAGPPMKVQFKNIMLKTY